VIAAVAAVWAIGLGVVDRAAPTVTRVYHDASPAARLERRPVLFIVSYEASDWASHGESGALLARATPIAVVEPNGELRVPLPSGGEPDARSAAERMFVDTYYRAGNVIRILRGGSNAGMMRIVDAAHREGALPTGRGSYDGPDPSVDVAAAGKETLLLGVSDPRLAAPTTGSEPMRASDRVVAAHLLRRAVADRYPEARVDEAQEVRVRAVDLDRDGHREVIAWAALRVRTEPQKQADVACFLIAETRDGSASYRTAFSYVAGGLDDPEGASKYSYVDQVDLSAAIHDEVVVSHKRADGQQYLVLRRGQEGWREVYRSSVVSGE
jgi:hypothetical protein